MRSKILSIFDFPLFFNLLQRLIADQQHVKKFVKLALSKLQPQSILDIGFGTGNFMEVIPKTSRYVGIDNNPRYFSFTKNRFAAPNREIFLQDASDINFYKGRYFDVVMLISILHHLSEEELFKILPAIKKITAKALIITDILPDPPGALPKLLVKLDRGRFIRNSQLKVAILKRYFKIVEVRQIPQGLGVQLGIICQPN